MSHIIMGNPRTLVTFWRTKVHPDLQRAFKGQPRTRYWARRARWRRCILHIGMIEIT